MEGGGVTALLVSAVDVLAGEQFFDTVQVSLLSSIEESTVPPQQVSQVTLLVFH